jgi:hypothetical protein
VKDAPIVLVLDLLDEGDGRSQDGALVVLVRDLKLGKGLLKVLDLLGNFEAAMSEANSGARSETTRR